MKRFRKMMISQAAKLLSDIGYELLGAAPFDLKTMTAHYRVMVDGTETVMTPKQIFNLLATKGK